MFLAAAADRHWDRVAGLDLRIQERARGGSGLAEFDRVDAVLEFSGAPTAMAATLATLDLGGRAVWIGATMPSHRTRSMPNR